MSRLASFVCTLFVVACPTPGAAAPAAAAGADAAYSKVAGEILTDFYKRKPSYATYLGLHEIRPATRGLLECRGDR